VAEWLNAALSKSVVRLIGVPGVRISPPPLVVHARVALSSDARVNRVALDGDWRAPLATPSVVFIEDGGCLGLAAW
jgi:hypothetical protein